MKLIGALLLMAAVGAAGLGLLGGILSLTGSTNSSGMTVMYVFVTPFWFYLFISGINDLSKKNERARWLKLAGAGLLLAAVVGIAVPFSIYLGNCDKRLVPGGRLVSCDLSGHDLHGLDLHGADLTYANLSGADLTGANLQGAHFKQTDLSGVSGLTDDSLAGFLGVQPGDLAQNTALSQIRLESWNSMQRALAGVCSGQAVSGVRSNPDETAFHTVLILDPDGNPSSGWSELAWTNGWQPAALRFTDLVACVGNQEKVRISTCDYSGGSTVVRNRYEVKVRLYAAATGELVSQVTLQGSDPSGCPSSIQQGGAVYNGSKVTSASLTNWLAKWVHPPVK